MGHFVELGDNPGEAAPGEYGPHALFSVRGDILIAGVGGIPQRLALPAAGKFYGSDGTDTLGRFPPGYTLATDLGATLTNNAAETTVLSAGAITGLFPAGVAVGDAVHIRAAGRWLNNSGGNQTLTLNVYDGATIVATAVSTSLGASGTARNWQLDVEVIYSIIGGAGAGAIRPIGSMLIGTGVGAAGSYQAPAAVSAFQINDGASATIATNAAATGDLKAQTSNGTATTTVTCNIFRARHFPKNY